MIKGTSRQMLEIINTGNPYFERAFLVIKPAFTDKPDDELEQEARRVLRAHNGYSGLRRARRWRRCGQLALLLLGGVLGVLIERTILTLL